MSLREVPLDSVPDVHHVPAGERQLRLDSVEVKPHKNNPENSFVMLRLSVVDDPDAKPIVSNIFFPTTDDDDPKAYCKIRQLKTFRDAWNLSVEKSSPTEFANALQGKIGETAWANLTEKDDPQYGMGNEVRSWVPSRR